MRAWIRSGEPWVWLTAGAVAASVILVAGLLLLIAVRGLVHFWPHPVYEFLVSGEDGTTTRLIGEIRDTERVAAERLGAQVPGEGDGKVTRYLLKTGNRDLLGLDFRWLPAPRIRERARPEDLVVMERREWGNLYGRLLALREQGRTVAEGEAAWAALAPRLAASRALHREIRAIETGEIGAINYRLERLRLQERGMALRGGPTLEQAAALAAEREALQARYAGLQQRLGALYARTGTETAAVQVMSGRVVEVPLSDLVRAYRPNAMGTAAQLGFYVDKLWEFLSEDPREANTEGGIFPAIFGTVLMVLLMSVIVTPFGVVAAVYLREYARQGPLVRTIRIAVNNLAGVPSIVYGVFGLGFFVYFLGGGIDQLFYPQALPAPTFGSPGLIWASLTLALLTVPVVIVSTEEGLARIPSSLREGSLALGATRAETLWRTVLPMASPAIMTGLILAVARAAGEVAPLMLVGVVKLAPALPVDGNPPFLHLERKFMHLGFHIYDVGFQSPNVEAARPLVYATALLLVAVIVVLNLTAIAIRNRLRERYRDLEV